MPYLSPPTLTHAEHKALLQATAGHPRDHVIISLALATGLRLGEIVGLNVGDLYFPDGTPRTSSCAPGNSRAETTTTAG
ncbi:MAG: Phage integrase family [candidate division NC10 bacterium]|nr:Phage integrase family [candidate division NC10 bacterium]